MADYKFLYEDVSRLQAEEMLATAACDGVYLVRKSESSKANVLSVWFQNRVTHFRILTTSDGRLRLESQAGVEQLYFDNLGQLLAYYTVPERGLPCQLKTPLEQQAHADSDDEEEPEDTVDGDTVEDGVALFFKQQYQTLFHSKRLPAADSVCEGHIQQYVAKGIRKDLKQVKAGAKRPLLLQQLLVDMAEDMLTALSTYSRRLDVLNDLFDVGKNADTKMLPQRKNTVRRKQSAPNHAPDLDSILNLLSSCKTHVLALERKACDVLQDYVGPTVQEQQVSSEQESYQLVTFTKEIPKVNPKGSSGVPKLFEVSVGPWKTKQFIAVDAKTGLLGFKKSYLEDFESGNTFSHDQIVQLVKPKDSKCKLGVRLHNKALKTYTFSDFRSRELFCQLVKCIRNMRSKAEQELSLLICSWNMADTGPPADISSWFRCQGSGKTRPEQLSDVPYDIVAVGTQETSMHEKEWISRLKAELKAAFNKDMKVVSCITLWGIRLVVFVQSEHEHCITQLKQSSVRTGIANTLGNKGAVGVSFSFNGTSLCFINCHLTSGNEKLRRRNQNFRDILRGLNLGQSETFGITNFFHHMFWFGDLNYRLDKPVTDILKKIMSRELRALAEESDQLLREQMRGTAFFGFEEEYLDFQPTYRYKPGTRDLYIWHKIKRSGIRTNVPSWCDRVLWRSFPNLPVSNTSYGCTDDICTSDHSPLFASFELGMLQQSQIDYALPGQADSSVKIEFVTLQAKIRTSSKTKFSIFMMSSCMEGSVRSRPNSISDWHNLPDALEIDLTKKIHQPYFSYPCWQEGDLPVITPALTDIGYLEDQFILMAVKGDDGDESYGEFVLPVARFLTPEPTVFDYPLSHLGEETGTIRGKVHIKMPHAVQLRRESSKSRKQALISVGDLDDETDPDDKTRKVSSANKQMYRKSAQVSGETEASRKADRGSTASPKASHHASLMRSVKNYPIGADLDALHEMSSSCPDLPSLPPKRRSSSPSSPQMRKPSPDVIWLSGRPSPDQGDGVFPFDSDTDSLPPESSLGNAIASPTPVAKPRTRHSFTRSLPHSIHDWLDRIGFVQYEEQLVSKGWDDLEFLDGLTDADLRDAGITNAEHRALIADSARIVTIRSRQASPSQPQQYQP